MLSLVALPSAWHAVAPSAAAFRPSRSSIHMAAGDAALIIQNKGGGHGESELPA